MEIIKEQSGTKMVVKLEGRLDAEKASELQQEACGSYDFAGIDALELDLTDLEYIASSGVRLFVQLNKRMRSKDGSLEIRNPNPVVAEILRTTGLAEALASS